MWTVLTAFNLNFFFLRNRVHQKSLEIGLWYISYIWEASKKIEFFKWKDLVIDFFLNIWRSGFFFRLWLVLKMYLLPEMMTKCIIMLAETHFKYVDKWLSLFQVLWKNTMGVFSFPTDVNTCPFLSFELFFIKWVLCYSDRFGFEYCSWLSSWTPMKTV